MNEYISILKKIYVIHGKNEILWSKFISYFDILCLIEVTKIYKKLPFIEVKSFQGDFSKVEYVIISDEIWEK